MYVKVALGLEVLQIRVISCVFSFLCDSIYYSFSRLGGGRQ